MKTASRVPRVLSLRIAKPGSAVAIYARVVSVSRSNKILHNVVRQRGDRKYLCTCENCILGGNRNCRHIRAVKARLRRLVAGRNL